MWQMVNLALSIAPKITGSILVMANPLYAYSTPKIVDNGQRMIFQPPISELLGEG